MERTAITTKKGPIMRFFLLFISVLAREIINSFDDGFTKILRFNKTDTRGKMLLAKFKISRLALKLNPYFNLMDEISVR